MTWSGSSSAKIISANAGKRARSANGMLKSDSGRQSVACRILRNSGSAVESVVLVPPEYPKP
jgi:hypothetical protein